MLLHSTTVLYYYYAIPSTPHQIKQIKSRLQLTQSTRTSLEHMYKISAGKSP